MFVRLLLNWSRTWLCTSFPKCVYLNVDFNWNKKSSILPSIEVLGCRQLLANWYSSIILLVIRFGPTFHLFFLVDKILPGTDEILTGDHESLFLLVRLLTKVESKLKYFSWLCQISEISVFYTSSKNHNSGTTWWNIKNLSLNLLILNFSQDLTVNC